MCLGVYLGTSRPLTIPDAAPGQLGVEKAKWTPPPLQRSDKFVYFLGEKGKDTEPLGCSCLLAEYVEWTHNAIIRSDTAYPDAVCPFDVLRTLCDEATRDGGFATIVCDDSNGVEQTCSEDDYCTGGLVSLALIARGSLLFADASGGIPWRVLHVVR